RSYISRYPTFPTAWLNLGNTLMRDARPREALAAFAEFMKLDSTSGNAYINMATSYSMLAKYDSAVLTYRKAFALRPDYETWFNLNQEYGMALVKSDRPAEARATFQKMLARPGPSDQARGHRSMALLELLEGHVASAVPRLKTATDINASLKETNSELRNRLFLVSAYEMLGNTGAARAELDKATAIYSRVFLDPVFVSRLAVALVRNGRADHAARMLDTIRARVSPGSNFDRAHMLLATAMVTSARSRSPGAADSARTMLQEAAVLDSSAEMLAPLARLRADAGDVRGAIESEQRVHRNQMNIGFEAQFSWVLTRYRLGQLYERLGDSTQARREYETFLTEWQDADQTLPAIVDTRARLKKLLALRPKPES
ncbi:MAG TPA: tetratricopeptide repeat protein, partial [Gemmatimonadaceae bacterium]|nr:tetratricopeptide repeat protein [Gemmatimonadaceae bacterium]